MKIDKELSVPLYEQVKNYLNNKIMSGEWGVGLQLPTEKELAIQFAVSTITVKRAVLELVNEGKLYRQSGKGTFVTQMEEKDISKFVAIRNERWETHHHPHKTLQFGRIQAGKKIAQLLALKKEDHVYRIQRVKIQHNESVALEDSYIPQHLFPDLQPEDIENDLLYNIFQEKYQMELGSAKIYFSTMLAREYEAAVLNVSVGEQLIVFERFTFVKHGGTIEYSKFIVKQDQSKYFLEINL
ncbi:MAG TPA: GntR family transcriptional regulator [Pseudogracilibacillus sp.]|nr:GntR family transcriptional regulator [Pseudogracilibacillus sp.]